MSIAPIELTARDLRLRGSVPVALVGFDCGRREVGLDSFRRLSGDLHAELAVFARRLADCRGCRPAAAASVRPLEGH